MSHERRVFSASPSSRQVPFGPFAFMPGKLVHTNEVTVLLGDNWFAKCSAKQAVGLAEHRKARRYRREGASGQRGLGLRAPSPGPALTDSTSAPRGSGRLRLGVCGRWGRGRAAAPWGTLASVFVCLWERRRGSVTPGGLWVEWGSHGNGSSWAL